MTKTWGLVIAGVIIGGLALFLTMQGNPPNMGVCVACFLRDTAGGLKLQTAASVQYMRPEIFGFAIGAFFAALLFREFRPTAGSVPLVRFTLGFFMMIGCLVFLGCPLRMLLRIAGGDLNAVIGLGGLVVGVLVGVVFLKINFALPRNQSQPGVEGLIFPALFIVLIVLVLLKGNLFASSTSGPASMHAPIYLSLIAGLIVGVIVQRTRFCTIGFISHLFLFKRASMFLGALALVLVVFVGDLALGKFKLGFEGQPIAHTDGLWNFLSMVLVGVCGVFLSGCPLRQIVKAGNADSDAGITVVGMLLGGAAAHNFSLASSSAGPTPGGKMLVIVGLGLAVFIGIIYTLLKSGKASPGTD